MAPEISVVVPVYNCEKFLSQALDSALSQTYPVKEVIVVDDGSVDQSLRIAQAFDSRVKVFSQAQQGPSAARNLGTAHATGDWIAFLDADDIWLPDKLEKQLKVSADFPNAGLIYSGRIELYVDGTTKPFPARGPGWVHRRLRLQNPLYPSTVIAKTALLRVNQWNSQFPSTEDWDIFYRLSRECQLACVADPTTYYRVYPESLSNRDYKSVLKHAQAVSRLIQQDFHGLEKLMIRARVDARLMANAAIAARAAGSDEFFTYITQSLRSWPFPDEMPARYKIFVKMLLQKLAVAKLA